MADDRANTDLHARISAESAWGGISRTDRCGFLAGHDLRISNAARDEGLAREMIVTIALGLLIFTAMVVGCAIVWPSYLSCRHLEETTGLIGGETRATCTWHTVRWRLSL